MGQILDTRVAYIVSVAILAHQGARVAFVSLLVILAHGRDVDEQSGRGVDPSRIDHISRILGRANDIMRVDF